MSGMPRRARRSRDRQRCVLGIDVGGTNIRAGLFVPRSGSMRHVRAVRTEALRNTALLTHSGRYSGNAEKGRFRVLVVWARRDGRWQQLASQMPPIVAP